MDEGLWEMDNDILRFKEERRTRPKPESRGFDQDFDSNFLSKLGLPSSGGGNPIRTPSGRVMASLKKDSDLYSNSSRLSEQDISADVMRYQRHENQWPDSPAREVNLEAQKERMKALEKQVQMLEQLNKSGLQRTSQIQNASEYDAKYGTGLPTSQNYGPRVKPRPESSVYGEDFVTKIAEGSRRGGAGAPLRASNGQVQARLPISFARNDFGEVFIHDRDGKLQRQGQGSKTHLDNEEVVTLPKKTVYSPPSADEEELEVSRKRLELARQRLEETKRVIEEEKNRKKQQDREMKFGGGDYASIMARGQVGYPRRDPVTGLITDHHLPTTDATREKTRTHERRFMNSASEPYKTVLERQAEERQLRQQVHKQQERVEARQHYANMNTFWGHPGGGAPKLDTQKYADFNDILHHSPRSRSEHDVRPTYNDYVPPVPAHTSTHRNMYEYPVPQKPSRKMDFAASAPFALH